MIRRPTPEENDYHIPRIKHLGQIGNDFGEIVSYFPQLEYQNATVFDQKLTYETWNFPAERGGMFVSISYGHIDGVIEEDHPLAKGQKIFFRLFRGYEEGQSTVRPQDHGMDVVAHPDHYTIIWTILQEMGLSIWPERNVVSSHNPMKRFFENKECLRKWKHNEYQLLHRINP